MKKYIALYALVAAALAAAPAIVNAQDSTAPKPHAAQAEQHANKKHPFHGKVKSVDAAAQTVTVGKTTITVTSDTKITKNGAPATFADITVGEKIGGSGIKDGERKLTATTLTIGEKPKAAGKKKKTESND